MIHLASVILLLISILSTVSVHADEGTKLTIAPAIMNFDYVETASDGTFLDGENGNIPGIRFGLDVASKTDMNFGLKFEYFKGVVDYDGHVQIDSNGQSILIPFQTDTDETVYSFSAFFLKHSKPSRTGLSMYGALTLKAWDRDIHGGLLSTTDDLGQPVTLVVSSTFEQYQWWQLDLGLHYKWLLNQKSYLQLYGGVLQTINPTLKVSVSELKMEENLGYKFGLEWVYRLSTKHSLGVGADYTYWEFGRSNEVYDPVIDRFIHEPDSVSKMLVFQFVYQYSY